MIIYIALFIVIMVAIVCYKNKVKINFHTFLKKGIYVTRGVWGVYVFDGKQGQGKTTSIVEFLKDNKNLDIYCNIKGIKGLDYAYFEGFEGLISVKKYLDHKKEKNNKQIVIVYDEIFTQLDKYSRLNKQIIDFLCQMRKRKIIFLTSCQSWAELPLSFRRFCRYQISCSIINFFRISIIKRVYHDAENMAWDNDSQDFVAPIIHTTISKYRKDIALSFDTYNIISSV